MHLRIRYFASAQYDNHININKAFFILIFLTSVFFAFKGPTLKGTYKYAGGFFHGKYEEASTIYSLQRKYDDKHFDAYILEDKQPPFKYQGGDYRLLGDSCMETETFSAQPSKLTGKTIKYGYTFHKDTLIFNGILPNGNAAEEHWIKIK